MASSSSNNPIFPDEVMVEILLKLPVKSILRCNTLSKHYYSLIHTQYFIRRHLHFRRLTEEIDGQSIAIPRRGSFRLFDQKVRHFKVLEGSPEIVVDEAICGPVDGLYCVIDEGNERFTVWNPSTRERLILPRIPRRMWSLFERVLPESNLFRRQCCGYGFGFDESSNEYKFVFIYVTVWNMPDDDGYIYLDEPDDVVRNSFCLFSMSEGGWRNSKESFEIAPTNINSKEGVFVCGACHWVYKQPGHYSCLRYTTVILAFDMMIESHTSIALPIVGDEYTWSDVSIATVTGGLALVNAQRRRYEYNNENINVTYSSFDVWVMAEYGVVESWTILFRVSLTEGVTNLFLGIVRDKLYVGEGHNRSMVSYDLYTKDEERYGGINIDYEGVCKLIPYEESLVRIVKSD